MGKYQVQIVKCYTLNVRKSASNSATIVAVVKVNQKFTSSKQSNGWYYIDEKKGWSYGGYIKVVKKLSSTAKPPTKTTKQIEAERAAARKKAEAAKRAAAEKQAKEDLKKIQKAVQNGTGGTAVRTDMIEQTVNAKSVDGTEYNLASTEGDTDAVITAASYIEGGVDANGVGLISNARVPEPPEKEGTVKKASTSGSSKAGVVTTFATDYTEFESMLDRIHKNHSIAPETNTVNWNNWRKFNRHRMDFPDSYLAKTVGYVFFTRPALNILTNDGEKLRGDLAYDPFWTSAFASKNAALKSLTSHWSGTHDFHNRLSNYALSFEVPDEILKTEEHGESMIGHKVQYGISNVESNTAGTFSVNFMEDPEYNIYNIHKFWVEYIARVHKGKILCNPKHRYQKILDYASSVYYFLCAPDGETILYWSKYFGVFPTNVPASGASWTKGASPKTLQYSINYAYSLKEDMETTTLFEFNRLRKITEAEGNFEYEPIYNPHIMRSGKTFTGSPFIQSVNDGTVRRYKLRFRK